jgi:hypothetical protein
VFGLTDAWHCKYLQSHIYMQLQHNCSVLTVWCHCQQAKTENSYRYEGTSSYGEQLTTPEILGILERMGKGRYFV